MSDQAYLFLAVLFALMGMALLALSLEAHWRQVFTTSPPKETGKKLLRTLGYVSQGLSLTFCLGADHPSMAALVWVMFLAGAAFAIGLLLAWSPGIRKSLSVLFVPSKVR
ncbi:MAG: DUF3325 domain-containing protein [Cellvibrionaceae bacterium]|nr:DUF3325 domain-containing protein [Cellvibrionaceae bacterium]